MENKEQHTNKYFCDHCKKDVKEETMIDVEVKGEEFGRQFCSEICKSRYFGDLNIRCTKCNHKWYYKGKSNYYVTCPHCYRKINLKSIEQEKEVAENNGTGQSIGKSDHEFDDGIPNNEF